MNQNICLPFNYTIILFCLILGFTILYIHMDKKKNINNTDYNYSDTFINKLEKIINKVDTQDNLYRDRKILNDSFYPPERRQGEPIYSNFIKYNNNFNIPTRGYPDNYQLIGIVLRNNTETAYNLFGRQTYPGSNKYEYYVEGIMHDTKVKLPIKTHGDREIEDNQTIIIPGTKQENGEFIVKLYDYELPRYNPYTIY